MLSFIICTKNTINPVINSMVWLCKVLLYFYLLTYHSQLHQSYQGSLLPRHTHWHWTHTLLHHTETVQRGKDLDFEENVCGHFFDFCLIFSICVENIPGCPRLMPVLKLAKKPLLFVFASVNNMTVIWEVVEKRSGKERSPVRTPLKVKNIILL